MKTPKRTFKLSAKVLVTRKEKVRGLIGNENIYPVYFETRFGIHTFGMKQSIDVLILNNNFQIVIMKKGMKPGKIFFWNLIHFRVIELPVNYINANLFDEIDLT